MFSSPWELDRHVRHRLARLAADRSATEAVPGLDLARAVARLRRGVGIGLIAAGERLAGMDAARSPRRSAPRTTSPAGAGW